MAINQGLAYGKVRVVSAKTAPVPPRKADDNQIRLLEDAIHKSALRLEQQAKAAVSGCSQAVASIYEAHSLMVKDPLLINQALELIKNHNMSAYTAYHTASQNIIRQFSEMTNDYMKNRIIDIEDAIGRVLAALRGDDYEESYDFFEPRILVLDRLRPSVLFNCSKKHVAGLIAENGAYNEHSCLIIRCKDVPALVIQEAGKLLDNDDRVLMDCDKGLLFRNPDPTFMNIYLKERR